VYEDVSGRSLTEQLVSHAERIRNLDAEVKTIQSLKYGSQKVMMPDLDTDRYVEREVTLKKIGDKDISYYDFYQDERWIRIYIMFNPAKDRLIYIRTNIYPLFTTNKTSLDVNRLDPPEGDIYVKIFNHDEVNRFLSALESAIK